MFTFVTVGPPRYKPRRFDVKATITYSTKRGSSEAQFFIASEITGISEAEPPQEPQASPHDEGNPALLALPIFAEDFGRTSCP